MPIDLPPPIDLYLKIENAGDIGSAVAMLCARCHGPRRGPFPQGLAAIRQWITATKQKYNHRVEPLDAANRDGKTIFTARLTGNFPGSPVTVDFRLRA